MNKAMSAFPTNRAPRRRSGKAVAGLVLAWSIVVVAGLCLSAQFASAPSATVDGPTRWPADSTIMHDANHSTFVVFLHPKCPCSRATIAELSVLLSKCQKPLALRVVFVRPRGVADGWERGPLWDLAAGIPEATLLVDVDGREADRFCATTSGEAFLYSAQGELAFHGGLTWARGHEGESLGRTNLESLIDGVASAPVRSPVYGCALKN